MRDYGITTVYGDNYAKEWPIEQFAQHGIKKDWRPFLGPGEVGAVMVIAQVVEKRGDDRVSSR